MGFYNLLFTEIFLTDTCRDICFFIFDEVVLQVITESDFLSWDLQFNLFDECNDHFLICEL